MDGNQQLCLDPAKLKCLVGNHVGLLVGSRIFQSGVHWIA